MRRLASWVFGIFIATYNIEAADKLHIVNLVDLSQTQETVGHTGKTEFEENIRAISIILANIPADSRITAIAITDRSYVNPFILLAGRTAPDPGPFSSRLISARRTLLAEWMKRSRSLQASFNQTDILGALRFTADVFARSDAARKRLALFSDMRQFSSELDLEKPKLIDVQKSLKQIDAVGGFVSLQGVEVWIFGAGAHGEDKGRAYANGLQAFWVEYFRRTGATLRIFSPTREAGALRELYGFAKQEGTK